MDWILFLPTGLQCALLSTFSVQKCGTVLDLLIDYQLFKKGLASWADIRILWLSTCQINGNLLITVLVPIIWFRLLFSCFLNDMSTVRFSAGDSRTLFPSWTFHRVLSTFFLSFKSIVTCTQELAGFINETYYRACNFYYPIVGSLLISIDVLNTLIPASVSQDSFLGPRLRFLGFFKGASLPNFDKIIGGS